MLTFDAEDINDVPYKNLKLLVEPLMSEIENIDLFKFIINGKT